MQFPPTIFELQVQLAGCSCAVMYFYMFSEIPCLVARLLKAKTAFQTADLQFILCFLQYSCCSDLSAVPFLIGS